MAMGPYVRRHIDDELDELLSALPAVALEGPRWVGKTATAERRAATVVRLDDPDERELVEASPRRVVEGAGPILLDEWQRVPSIWDRVRRAVDDGAEPGRFLLTGSTTPVELPVHSGAGRIVSLRMRPMSLCERGVAVPTVSVRSLLRGGRPELTGSCDVELEQYADEIVRSGFPAVRALSPRLRRAQLDGYISRVAERDLGEVGPRLRHPQGFRRWFTAYGAATATCASFEAIRRAASAGEETMLARTTTRPYRDALERLFLIDPVDAWLPSRNQFARLASPPKHHLADPALAARLLGVDDGGLLAGTPTGPPIPRNGPLLGSLFESLVALSIRVYAQAAEARVGHLRSRSGDREIDLIVERGDGRVIAVEVKLGGEIKDHDLRHLRWLNHQLGDDVLDSLVITTGRHAFRRPDGIGVIPAALLGP